MLNKDRFNRILSEMQKNDLRQMIITDPYAIYYLLGKMFAPGERMLALYVNTDRVAKLVLNELFPQYEDLGVEIIWYNDTNDGVEVLSKHIESFEKIGVDKTWQAGFLIRLQDLLKDRKYVNGSKIVDNVRKVKDETEKELMRKSSAINDAVMQEIIPLVTKGYTEKELNDRVKEIFVKNGAEGLSFEPITAYGKNAADPHHETDNSKASVGDCVVLDIGCYYGGYASDMTRTVFIGQVSDRHREVYEVVKEANRRGRAAAKPGAKMSDVDFAARDYIEKMGFGEYFTHRTGHSIGLETHEYGDVSLANDAIIEVGQCFSVEPGIYIAEENIGVRIEDLVIVTEDGCETINKISRELTVVEV